MPRYFSTFELSQKAKSEKTLLSNKRHKEDAMGQTEDEKLLEIFKADLKAGEFRELDPVKILSSRGLFERWVQLSSKYAEYDGSGSLLE